MMITDQWLQEKKACQDGIDRIHQETTRDSDELIEIAFVQGLWRWFLWLVLMTRDDKRKEIMEAILIELYGTPDVSDVQRYIIKIVAYPDEPRMVSLAAIARKHL